MPRQSRRCGKPSRKLLRRTVERGHPSQTNSRKLTGQRVDPHRARYWEEIVSIGERCRSRMLGNSLFSPAQPRRAGDAPFPMQRSRIVRTLNGDPAASPLGGAHRLGAPYSSHRAPRGGYASGPSLAAAWLTAFLSILWGVVCSYPRRASHRSSACRNFSAAC